MNIRDAFAHMAQCPLCRVAVVQIAVCAVTAGLAFWGLCWLCGVDP